MPDGLIIAAAIVLFFFAILAVVVLWKLSSKLWRLAGSGVTLFGRTAQIRIVGLGVVAWLFPRAVGSPFFVVFNPIYTMVLQLPSIFSAIPAIFAMSDTSSRARMIGALASDLASVGARSLYSITTSLNIPEFAMALMVWVILGQILDAMWADPEQKNRLFTFFKSMDPPQRQNFYLVVLLLFGSYLSIAAIASIPWLRETGTPIETDSSRLSSRLAEIRLSDQEFSKRFPDPAPDFKAFHETETFINTTFGSSPQPNSPSATDAKSPVVVESKTASPDKTATDKNSSAPPKPSRVSATLPSGTGPSGDSGPKISEEDVATERRVVRENLADALSRGQTERGERLRQWHDLAQRSRDEEDKLQKTVISAFEENSVGRKGSQERARYFSELDDWYRETVGSLDDRLGACLSSINSADDQWARDSQLLRAWAGSRLDSIRIAQQYNNFLPVDNGSSLLLGVPSTYAEICSLPTFEESLPQPPSPGASWGPFGIVASWLLKTESLQLALITGMLGFGLLGSAVSSFVQERKQRRTSFGPLVSDLPSVLIRGFSAAIVVFLAAEGGLAIFSGSGSVDPNPYILMFTCFTAAVFSQAAWDRVRHKLGDSDQQKDPAQAAENAANKTTSPAVSVSANTETAVATEPGDSAPNKAAADSEAEQEGGELDR